MNNRLANQEGRTIDVVLANMAGMFAELLISVLTGDPKIRVVGSASSQSELKSILTGFKPEIVLTGTEGWGGESDVLSLLQQVVAASPTTRTIVLSAEMVSEDVVSFFRSGARGLLCASQSDIALLTKCIYCVSEGQIWASASQLDLLIRSLSVPRSFKLTSVLGDNLLSKREEEVLYYLADGLTNRELAATLKLSEHTVKNHLFRIFEKLGVSTRMEAVLYAITQREQRNLHRPPNNVVPVDACISSDKNFRHA